MLKTSSVLSAMWKRYIFSNVLKVATESAWLQINEPSWIQCHWHKIWSTAGTCWAHTCGSFHVGWHRHDWNKTAV